MKKVITVTVLLFGLSTGLSSPLVIAAQHSDAPVVEKSAQQSWQDALKAQVSLAKAKVSLLQVRSELWVAKNKGAALQSLDEARASLDEGWHSADQTTRARIEELIQIDQAKLLLKEKRQGAEAELYAIANGTESALNAALAKTQTKSSVLKSEAASRYALVQANAAALKARVALEIEESPEKAQQALKEAEEALLLAKENASNIKVVLQIAKLQQQAQAAKQSVNGEIDKAKTHISALVTATNAQIGAYEKKLQESDEVKLLKRRYVQLEAQAALLKAQLATKADTTGEQATAYLNESKAWYESLKVEASTRSEKELAKMLAAIEEAKQAVEHKDRQARARLAELLEQAAEMVEN